MCWVDQVEKDGSGEIQSEKCFREIQSENKKVLGRSIHKRFWGNQLGAGEALQKVLGSSNQNKVLRRCSRKGFGATQPQAPVAIAGVCTRG